MTTTVLPSSPAGSPAGSPAAAFDEPDGVAARGTVVVLTGRGETVAAYGRLGRRLAGDAYKVRVASTRAEVEALLADATLPAPRVLLGSDTGATLAASLLEELDVDAAVLAGLALAGAPAPDGWDDELEARTACPAHRRVLSSDDGFARGALSDPVPDLPAPTPVKPVLVLHGSADPLTPADAAFAPYLDAPAAFVHLVEGGRHDVLNDVMHRSVAATIVLFLERLKLGADLPVIVHPAS